MYVCSNGGSKTKELMENLLLLTVHRVIPQGAIPFEFVVDNNSTYEQMEIKNIQCRYK